MKVLDVTEFYSERGGGVRSHLGLKGHVLCQLGHDHVVLAPGPQDVEETVSGHVAQGGGSARLIRVRGPASPYDPTYHLLLRFDKIAAIVARERPDVLEIHSPYLAALGALRAAPGTYGVRTFQWHSDFIDTYAGVLGAQIERSAAERSKIAQTVGAPLALRALGRATLPLWGLVRSIARRCDATLVAAQWQVAKLTAHGVPNVVPMPFGIERETFCAGARSYEGRRELLAMAGRDAAADTTILVGVGRFAIEKRWDVVIDAFVRVREQRDAILVLFGDGPERARMTARCAGSVDIAMPGFVKDRETLARALASADALVHGCPFETFGLSIAEAMSCGLPVVVPDEGGAAEMHDPRAGERYGSGDVDACARAILALLDRLGHDEAGVRAAALDAVRRLPNVRGQFEQQIAVYEDLLARKGSS